MSIEYRNSLRSGVFYFTTTICYFNSKTQIEFINEILKYIYSNDFITPSEKVFIERWNFDLMKSEKSDYLLKQLIDSCKNWMRIKEGKICIPLSINAYSDSKKIIQIHNSLLLEFNFHQADEKFTIVFHISDCLLPLRITNPNFKSVSNWNIYQNNKFRFRNFLLSINNIGIWEEDYSLKVSTDLSDEGHFTTGTDLILRYGRIKNYIDGFEEDEIDPNVNLEEYRKDYPFEDYGQTEESFG